MKTNKIRAGDIFTSYKQLSESLEEGTKSGNAKVAQIKNWGNYFDFERKGNKYIIKEVYDKPKGYITQYGFITDVEDLVLNLLVQQQREKLFIPKSTMFKELAMTNENYNELRYHIPKLSIFSNIGVDEIEEFYDLSRNSMIGSIKTALNNLEQRKLIFHRDGISLCQIEVKPELNETFDYKAKKTIKSYDDYGNPEYEFSVQDDFKYVHREANEDEIRQVTRIERESLMKLNCESEHELIKKGKWEAYKKMVNDRLWDEMNVLYTYKCYEIIFNQDHVTKFWMDIKKFRIEEIIEQAKKVNVNNTMKNKMIRNAEKRYEKAIEMESNSFADDVSITKEERKKFEHRIRGEYVKNVKELVNMLIDIENDSIKQQVKSTKIEKLPKLD